MNDSYKDIYPNLDNRLDKLSERIAKIEGKIEEDKKKSLRHLLAEFGGLLALVISISIGAFTIYEKLILEPKQEISIKESELREKLTQLSNIRSQISQHISSGTNDSILQIQLLANQRAILLKEIKSEIEKFSHVLKYEDRATLSVDYYDMGMYVDALNEAIKAVEMSTGQMQKAQSHAILGKVYFALKDIKNMRVNFELAQNNTDGLSTYLTSGFLTELFSTWFLFEIALEECENSLNVKKRLDEHLKINPIPVNLKPIYIQNYINAKSQMPSNLKCKAPENIY